MNRPRFLQLRPQQRGRVSAPQGDLRSALSSRVPAAGVSGTDECSLLRSHRVHGRTCQLCLQLPREREGMTHPRPEYNLRAHPERRDTFFESGRHTCKFPAPFCQHTERDDYNCICEHRCNTRNKATMAESTVAYMVMRIAIV